MFKKLGFILQLLAFTIVLGHNITPHEHERHTPNISCESEHESESILEFLIEHLFHANTGIDHLEDFGANKLSVAFILPQKTNTYQSLTCRTFEDNFSTGEKKLNKGHHYLRPLRAPPASLV